MPSGAATRIGMTIASAGAAMSGDVMLVDAAGPAAGCVRQHCSAVLFGIACRQCDLQHCFDPMLTR